MIKKIVCNDYCYCSFTNDKKEEDDINTKCCICIDSNKTHAFVPCGHQCVCGNCAIGLQLCPICRVNIENILKIYN